MAALNPNQFASDDPDDYDHTKWNRGDVIGLPDREVTLRSGKTLTEPGQRWTYDGPAAGANHISVYDPSRETDEVYHSMTAKSLRVFKDGKVRHTKDAEPFRRIKP